MKTTNKIVFVTGSSRGIGKAIAKAFLKDGHTVILHGGHDKERLLATYAELSKDYTAIHSVFGDVSSYKECQRIIEEIHEAVGEIDVLVHNAGVSHIGLFTDMKPAEYEALMQTNLFSVFHLSHLVIPSMVAKKSGFILGISSIWGESGASCEAVYSASKAGMNAFCKSMAKELGPSGIRVNALACGAIDTEMNQNLSIEEKELFAEQISLSRFGTPEEVASFVVCLAGDGASYLTGQVVTLDGGM
ncbi:MAG: 3-oxoacyl-ACP reductase FabG [Bacillota bacterium]